MANIIEFIEDDALIGDKNLSPAQRMSLKAVYGLPLSPEERSLFRETTGRQGYVPGTEQSEVTFCLGRRAGKSDKLAANIAVYEACARDFKFSVGEIPIVMIVSTEKERQSRIVFQYVLQKMERSLILKRMIKSVTTQEIRLKNRAIIQVYPCAVAQIRGASLLCFIGDECAWWRVEGKDVDTEILSAARPGLSFEHSKLIKISTPYMRRGEIWNDYRRYFGKDDAEVLVFQGATELFNPSFSKIKLDHAQEKDPVAYEAEFLARFRQDLSSMYEPESVDRAINFDRPMEMGYREGNEYHAFVDTAGGGGRDCYAISIGHRDREGERIVVDVVRSRAPKFDPAEVTAQYCELLKSYKVFRITGDKFSGDFASSLFAKGGIEYIRSEKTKSELYLEAESVFNTGGADIPNRAILIDQLKRLVRKVRSGGKDSVDVEVGSEDEANVVCGLVTLVSGKKELRKGKIFFHGRRVGGPPQPPQPTAAVTGSLPIQTPEPYVGPRRGRVFCGGRSPSSSIIPKPLSEEEIARFEADRAARHDAIVKRDMARARSFPRQPEDPPEDD